MAHATQRKYCESIKAKFPSFFDGKRVLDVGSLNINGTIKDLFTNCKYTGLDIAPGNNVDVVCKMHEYSTEELFDVITSCSAFEHDMYLSLTLKKIVQLLKPGGLFFFTSVTKNWPEHGTETKDPGASPFTTKIEEWKNYYKNISIEYIMAELDVENIFSEYEFDERNINELYFYGIKK